MKYAAFDVRLKRMNILLEAMTIVGSNQIKKNHIRCEDSEDEFVCRVMRRSSTFRDIRVIFDHYDVKSIYQLYNQRSKIEILLSIS